MQTNRRHRSAVQAVPQMKTMRGRRCMWKAVTMRYRRTYWSPKPLARMMSNSRSSSSGCAGAGQGLGLGLRVRSGVKFLVTRQLGSFAKARLASDLVCCCASPSPLSSANPSVQRVSYGAGPLCVSMT